MSSISLSTPVASLQKVPSAVRTALSLTGVTVLVLGILATTLCKGIFSTEVIRAVTTGCFVTGTFALSASLLLFAIKSCQHKKTYDPFAFTALPIDLQKAIVLYLDPITLGICARVSKVFKTLVEDESIWKSLIQSSPDIPYLPMATTSWKTIYLTYSFFIGPGRYIAKRNPKLKKIPLGRDTTPFLSMHKDEHLLATWGCHNVYVFNLKQRKFVSEIPFIHIRNIAFISETVAVILEKTSEVCLWDSKTKQKTSLGPLEYKHSQILKVSNFLIFSPCKIDEKSEIWDLNSERFIEPIEGKVHLHHENTCLVETPNYFIGLDLVTRSEKWRFERKAHKFHKDLNERYFAIHETDHIVKVFDLCSGATYEIKTEMNSITSLKLLNDFILLDNGCTIGRKDDVEIYQVSTQKLIYKNHEFQSVRWLQPNLLFGWYPNYEDDDIQWRVTNVFTGQILKAWGNAPRYIYNEGLFNHQIFYGDFNTDLQILDFNP